MEEIKAANSGKGLVVRDIEAHGGAGGDSHALAHLFSARCLEFSAAVSLTAHGIVVSFQTLRCLSMLGGKACSASVVAGGEEYTPCSPSVRYFASMAKCFPLRSFEAPSKFFIMMVVEMWFWLYLLLGSAEAFHVFAPHEGRVMHAHQLI